MSCRRLLYRSMFANITSSIRLRVGLRFAGTRSAGRQGHLLPSGLQHAVHSQVLDELVLRQRSCRARVSSIHEKGCDAATMRSREGERTSVHGLTFPLGSLHRHSVLENHHSGQAIHLPRKADVSNRRHKNARQQQRAENFSISAGLGSVSILTTFSASAPNSWHERVGTGRATKRPQRRASATLATTFEMSLHGPHLQCDSAAQRWKEGRYGRPERKQDSAAS